MANQNNGGGSTGAPQQPAVSDVEEIVRAISDKIDNKTEEVLRKVQPALDKYARTSKLPKYSFWLAVAVIAALVGLVFLVAPFFYLSDTKLYLGLSIGVLLELLSAVYFILYGRTSTRLQKSMDRIASLRLAYHMTEELEGNCKQLARAELAKRVYMDEEEV